MQWLSKEHLAWDRMAEVKSGKTAAHGYRIGKYMKSLGRFGEIF